MATALFNISLGQVVQLYKNVVNNSPANSGIVLVVIETSEADDVLLDLDNLALVLANANTAEVTNAGYYRVVFTDADLAAYAPDDVNNRVDLDLPDHTWVDVAAGDSWTDIVVCYDPDTTVGDDTTLQPLTLHDFEVVPDGRSIPLHVGANGFYRSSR